MYMDPTTMLQILEQDREREMTKRALQRAARAGNQQPGLARGGIATFIRALTQLVGGSARLDNGQPTSGARPGAATAA